MIDALENAIIPDDNDGMCVFSNQSAKKRNQKKSILSCIFIEMQIIFG